MSNMEDFHGKCKQDCFLIITVIHTHPRSSLINFDIENRLYKKWYFSFTELIRRRCL